MHEDSAFGNLSAGKQYCQQNGSTSQHKITADRLFFGQFGRQFFQFREIITRTRPDTVNSVA